MEQNEFYVYFNFTIPGADMEAAGKRAPFWGSDLARWYTGVSLSPPGRLKQHNSGKVKSTAGRKWKTALAIGPYSAKVAFALEAYFKTGNTRHKRLSLFNSWVNLRGNPERSTIIAQMYASAVAGHMSLKVSQHGPVTEQEKVEAAACWEVAERERQGS